MNRFGRALATLLAIPGCAARPHARAENVTLAAPAPGAPSPDASAPPAVAVAGSTHGLRVTPNVEGLIFTWIDERGDFHIATRTSEVPPQARDAVRVVDPNQDEEAGKIRVVDLREVGFDGAYPVRVTTREAFEAVARARRP